MCDSDQNFHVIRTSSMYRRNIKRGHIEEKCETILRSPIVDYVRSKINLQTEILHIILLLSFRYLTMGGK